MDVTEKSSSRDAVRTGLFRRVFFFLRTFMYAYFPSVLVHVGTSFGLRWSAGCLIGRSVGRWSVDWSVCWSKERLLSGYISNG